MEGGGVGCLLCRLQLPEVQFGSETAVRGALEKGTCGFSNAGQRTTKKEKEKEKAEKAES